MVLWSALPRAHVPGDGRSLLAREHPARDRHLDDDLDEAIQDRDRLGGLSAQRRQRDADRPNARDCGTQHVRDGAGLPGAAGADHGDSLSDTGAAPQAALDRDHAEQLVERNVVDPQVVEAGSACERVRIPQEDEPLHRHYDTT